MGKVGLAVMSILIVAGYADADVMVYGQGDDVTISRPYCSV
jgi:hypothetical protein